MTTSTTPAASGLDDGRRPAASSNNGLAIAGFILAWLLPLIGAILGMASISEAHGRGQRASGLAVAAVWLGFIFSAAIVIGAVVLVTHHGAAPACDYTNPNWPDC